MWRLQMVGSRCVCGFLIGFDGGMDFLGFFFGKF
jgi:hypothetical protein